MRLTQKVCIVTGAARGIGRAIAERFAREGASVAAGDLDAAAAGAVAAAIQGTGASRAIGLELDVASWDSMRAMVDRAQAELGPVDILVNNAGISKVVPFLEMEEALWDATLAVNLKGAYLGCRAVLPGMVERGQGVIINMSSQSGKKGNSHYAAYCASKFGIIGLTQSLAQEFAESGIRINAICPGVVFTDLWKSSDMLDEYARKRGIRPDEVEDHFKRTIPMGRLGTVEDVANVAVFLASDDSAYMTGQALNVTGGAEMR